MPHRAQIATLEQALQEAERRQDDLLAALAHELRNPLSALSASVQVLRRPDLSEASHARALDLMQRQVFQMSRVVDELLEVSRIARRQVHPQHQVLDLVALTTATVHDHGTDGTGALELLDPGAPIWVDGDPALLAQALSTLLNYALQAGRRSARRLRVRIAEGRAEVALEYEGEEPEPSASEPFWTTLSLLRGLVEIQGGALRACCQGPCCTLALRLPLAPEPEHPGAG